MHDSQQRELIQWIGVTVVAIRPPQLAVSLPTGHKRLAFHVSKRRADPHTGFAVDSGHEQRRVLRAVCVTPILDHIVGVGTCDRHIVIGGQRFLPSVTLVRSQQRFVRRRATDKGQAENEAKFRELDF